MFYFCIFSNELESVEATCFIKSSVLSHPDTKNTRKQLLNAGSAMIRSNSGKPGCHDIRHNDTQHNDTQHNDTQHNDTQHNDTEYNDTQ